MKEFKIFLASSIEEFKKERNRIGAFVGKVNQVLETYDVKIHLYLCEYVMNAISLERKQNEYNEIIQKCDCFVSLFKEFSGQYSIEECNVASLHYEKFSHPSIQVFVDSNHEETKKNVLSHCVNSKIPICEFTKISEVQLYILNQALDYFHISYLKQIKDDSVYLDHKKVLIIE